MVHRAVYDAVNAIAGRPYQPYLVAPRTNGRESVDAAVGTAAFQVLSSLFPTQQARLRTQYDEWRPRSPTAARTTAGYRWGSQTAAAMISARQGDRAFGDPAWPVEYRARPSGDPRRRPTPTTGPGWRTSSRSSFRARRCSARPVRRRSAERSVRPRLQREVKAIGAVNSPIRTSRARPRRRSGGTTDTWGSGRSGANSPRPAAEHACRRRGCSRWSTSPRPTPPPPADNEKRAWMFWRPGHRDPAGRHRRQPDHRRGRRLDAAARHAAAPGLHLRGTPASPRRACRR